VHVFVYVYVFLFIIVCGLLLIVQYVFQPAMLFMHDVSERKEEGVAIFSRYPILSSDYILLYR